IIHFVPILNPFKTGSSFYQFLLPIWDTIAIGTLAMIIEGFVSDFAPNLTIILYGPGSEIFKRKWRKWAGRKGEMVPKED
ncbi:MAG: hypothetical protein J6X48_06600, partial [Lachnospiraceae bacterium]|nr:hypothetical protein [Lachnospiraceae bacterium]